jgi:hypothetical protein
MYATVLIYAAISDIGNPVSSRRLIYSNHLGTNPDSLQRASILAMRFDDTGPHSDRLLDSLVASVVDTVAAGLLPSSPAYYITKEEEYERESS